MAVVRSIPLFIAIVFFVNAVGALKLTAEELQALHEQCGKPLAHAHSGNQSHQADAPWAVRLQIGTKACTGSFISPRHILTARHCVYHNWTEIPRADAKKCQKSHYLTRVDRITLSTVNTRATTSCEVLLFEMCLPPSKIYDDIAVIELPFNHSVTNVRPVCLYTGIVPAHTKLTIAAFGTGKTALKMGSATMIGQNDGQAFYPGFDSNVGREAGSSGASLTYTHNNGRSSILGVVIRRKSDSFAISTNKQNLDNICDFFNICY